MRLVPRNELVKLGKGGPGSRGGKVVGYFAGAMPGLTGLTMRETAKVPETDPHFSALPNKAKDFIRERPWIGGVRGAAIGAAIPLGAAYTLRKYYPGTYARAAEGIKSLGKMV